MGNVRDRLDLQFQDTYYRIVLQAHNQMGFSQESSIIIKTKKGDDGSNSTTPHWGRPTELPLVPIILTIIGVLIILIILTDLIFYKTRETGEDSRTNKFRCVKVKIFGRNHISGLQNYTAV